MGSGRKSDLRDYKSILSLGTERERERERESETERERKEERSGDLERARKNKSNPTRAGEMAQQPRVGTSLAKDQSSVPSTHITCSNWV